MSLMDQARLYQGNVSSCEIVPAFKVDEGYSEDNRSQDDVDSPAKFELLATGTNMSVRMLSSLPEGIMALSEAERSGMFASLLCYALVQTYYQTMTDERPRLCVQYITDLTDIVYSCDCGAVEAASPY